MVEYKYTDILISPKFVLNLGRAILHRVPHRARTVPCRHLNCKANNTLYVLNDLNKINVIKLNFIKLCFENMFSPQDNFILLSHGSHSSTSVMTL